MKNIDKELIDWAVKKIETDYPEDVDLLIGQIGACKIDSDEQNMSFDFFIPATGKGYNLSKTFIIEDMGYDLFPIDWERLKGIVDLNEPRMIFAFDLGEVIYSRNDSVKEKYENLKQQMRDKLKDKKITYPKSLEFINTSMEIFQTMVFDDSFCHVRKAASGIAFYLVNAFAFINGTYLRSGFMNLSSDIEKIEKMPEDFLQQYHKMFEAGSIKELIDICYQMIKMTRDFFVQFMPSKEDEPKDYNYDDLADWYQEARYTFRRIEYYCKEDDYERAYMGGCYLQIEFDAIKDEFGLKELDLMGAYDKSNLREYSRRSEELERYIVDVLKKNNAELKIYRSLEEFLEEQG